MALNTSSVGLRAIQVAGATTPVSITASTALVLPTPNQRLKGGGVMEATVSVEGTNTSRYTWNGVTPTSAIGILIPASTATTPVILTLVGEDLITAFRIIGTAAGNFITYQFAVRDIR